MKEVLFEIGDKIMKGFLSMNADQVIALPSHAERLMVRFSNNKITVVQNWSLMGVDALAVFGKKRVITRFEDVSEEGIRKGIDRAVRSAQMAPDSEDITDVESKKFPDRPTSSRIDPEKINDSVTAGINSALSEGAERCAGVFTAEVRRSGLLTSSGGEGYDERGAYEFNVRAFSGEGSGQGLSCGASMGMIDPEGAGGEAGRIAKLSSSSMPWTEGRYDVILGPIITGNLVERVGDACSAFSVEAGVSFLAGKVGEAVFSEAISLEDDGTDPEGINSRSFDDEGVPTAKTRLIENGRLIGYLHNKSTAKRFGGKTTGNAGWISPSPWNLKLEGGRIPQDELVKEMRHGVLVVSNWYTRFQNYSTGEFSTICRDGTFLIENGEIKGAMRGARISDNLLRLFGAVSEVSSERSWVRWWEVRTPALVPAILARGVGITKAQGS